MHDVRSKHHPQDRLPDGRPPLRRLADQVIERFSGHVTLLAVCPNSEAVARAALAAAHEADCPMLFAATLNQVDRDGGYTGWTPRQFVRFVEEEAARLRLTTPVFPCLDHGGPWLKDRHTVDGLSLAETMSEVKQSLEACIDAGYALLHIDPTVERNRAAPHPLLTDVVVERTLELIVHAEEHRRRQNRAPIDYEVGTEEMEGGLADVAAVGAFLRQLEDGLRSRHMKEAWPTFVVGRVGTRLDSSRFDAEVAAKLTAEVRPYGSLVKGHYTDFVDDLHLYPLSGMGGANVGPELTAVEFEALLDLVRLEGALGKQSDFETALRESVVESGRWTKWLAPDEQGVAFDSLAGNRRQWLLKTGSRYVWTDPKVLHARNELYENVRAHRDPDRFVVWRIKTTIMRYIHAFNLAGFNRRLSGGSG